MGGLGWRWTGGSRAWLTGTGVLLIVVGAIVAVLWKVPFSGQARLTEWPQWCGSDGRNMVAESQGIPESFTPGDRDPQGGFRPETAKNVRWRAHLGAKSYSSPVIAGGRVFIGGVLNEKGFLRCLDARTGRLVWQWLAPARAVPHSIDPGGRGFPFYICQQVLGVCSSATIEDGRVYFVSQRGDVMCLDTAGDQAKIAARDARTRGSQPDAPDETDTSKVLWTYDMYEGVGTRPADICNSAILIVGDLLYVGTSNGVDRDPDVAHHDELRPVPAPQAPSLIVLEKKTGRLVATDDAGIGPRLLHGQWSSPTRARAGGRDLILHGGGDGILYAFEALTRVPERPVKLKTVWTFDCNPKPYQDEYKKMKVDRIKHYMLGDRLRTDSQNKKNDGRFVGMSQIIATPVFYEGRIYVTIGREPTHGRGRGALWCIDPSGAGDITKTGVVWCYTDMDRSMAEASIHDGLLYIADIAGNLHCLDAKNGRPFWVHQTDEETWGSTLVVDRKVFLPTTKALWVMAEGKVKRELGKNRFGSEIYHTPVVTGGTLFISSGHDLWAVGKNEDGSN